MAQAATPPAAVTAPTPPNKPQWDCKIASQPKDPQGFTVGEVFQVDCEGASLTLKEPLKIELAEKQQYALVLLKPLQLTGNQLKFAATSYRPGPQQLPFLHVSDADGGGFISQPVQFQVKSVMNPQKPQENPYGPIGPIAMAWPYWIFFAALLLGLVLLTWLLVFIRQRLQQKNLEKNIRKFESPLGSYHQFSKDLRQLKRGVVFSTNHTWSESQTQDYLKRLDDIFRMFVLREYIVPATTWSNPKITKVVKKKNRRGYEQFRAAYLKAFKELERALSQPQKMTAQDCEQLSGICWQAVDQMWKHRRGITL